MLPADKDAAAPVPEDEPAQGYPLDHVRGYAPLPRSVGTFEPLLKDHVALAVYVVLLTRAAAAPGWRRSSRGNVSVDRGQALVGREELANEIGVAKSTAGAALARLERIGLIRQQADRSGTVVTLLSYGEFGDLDDAARPIADRKPTVSRPIADRRPTASRPKTDPKERGKGGTGERGNEGTLFAAAGVESESGPGRFDLEGIYALYPRKVGKKPGMAKLAKSIRTPADYERLRASVQRMSEGWQGKELTYCPHFSTYASKELWRDDDPPLPRRDLRAPATAEEHARDAADKEFTW